MSRPGGGGTLPKSYLDSLHIWLFWFATLLYNIFENLIPLQRQGWFYDSFWAKKLHLVRLYWLCAERRLAIILSLRETSVFFLILIRLNFLENFKYSLKGISCVIKQYVITYNFTYFHNFHQSKIVRRKRNFLEFQVFFAVVSLGPNVSPNSQSWQAL